MNGLRKARDTVESGSERLVAFATVLGTPSFV